MKAGSQVQRAGLNMISFIAAMTEGKAVQQKGPNVISFRAAIVASTHMQHVGMRASGRWTS
eukprot:6716896-Karenia_brevis.AAC.1